MNTKYVGYGNQVVEFSSGGYKSRFFLSKNKNTLRKLLNIESWISGKVSTIRHNFSK